MRILVTGAGGYIGSACVRAFARTGWTVRAASRGRLSTDGVESVRIDSIGGQTPWHDCLAGVDVVLHVAGVAHARRSDAALYQRVNRDGTARLARAAADAGVQRFVFVSSIAVYGRGGASRKLDESTQLQPSDPYGVSKKDAETALARSCEGRAMAWTVVRPPLVYGPSAPGNFGRLVGLVRRGIPLPFAAVNAPRSYIGLDNLVSALERAVTHPAAANQAFLVSDGQDVGAAQLVRWIALGLGRCPRLWRVPESLLRSCAGALGRADDAARLLDPMHIDSRRFRETLHWEPHMSVEEGVRRSVAGVDAGSR